MQRPWSGRVLGPQRHLEEVSVAGAAWEVSREASQHVLRKRVGVPEGSAHHLLKV